MLLIRKRVKGGYSYQYTYLRIDLSVWRVISMRVNEPVTNTEVTYNKSQKIVSTTDVNGSITNVNEHFINISGFTEDELLGQPHNMVRHPWMPEMAFKELWDCNKSQRPWMGMVKNRCKNGDYYWVDAFVSPMMEDGKTVGFQSVRSKPDSETIARAEAYYDKKSSVVESLLDKVQSTPLNIKLFASFSCCTVLGFLGFMVTQSPIIALLLVIVANIVCSVLISRPWVAYCSETESLISSPIAKKVYTGRNDELGQLKLVVKYLQSQQDTILYRAKGAAEQVNSSSVEALEQVDSTAKSTDVLYKEVELAATAIHEMSATVQEVSRNAAETSSAAAESKSNVDKGQFTLQETKEAMSDLVDAIDRSSATIAELNENSASIGSVVDVISSIADQTNLLALNAAIEAARAGEQGRGFAVVADEVRSLAAKTQESTSQISEMISALQAGTGVAVDSISKSHAQVQTGAEKIVSLDEQFSTILDNVDNISNMCIHIASATEEQSVVSEEINRNITNINTIGQENVESMHVLKSVNERLQGASQKMNDMVRQFNNS